MKFFCVALVLFFTSISFPQQDVSIQVHAFSGIKIIKPHIREGIVYIPVNEFADALRLKYVNDTQEHICVRGNNSDLTISAGNPFYLITDKSGKVIRTYQIPTSVYMISNRLYIPLGYSINLLNELFGPGINYDVNRKIITYKTEEIPIENNSNSFHITSLKIEEKANGTLVRFVSDSFIPDFKRSFEHGILKVTLNGVSADPGIAYRFSPSGLIRKIEIIQEEDKTEFQLFVGEQYSASELIRLGEGNDLLLTIHNKIFTNKNNEERNKEKWNFDVIVLDPGHGGRDAGAIGINGVKEKDINLSVALSLGELIEENMPGVKVEYTRKTDTFVELYKRGKIANEKNGKLFISIHCNSTPGRSSSAAGFEVYLLRPGRTQEAIGIAERENSVIEYEDDPKRYQQLTDENFILVSMAHSSYMKYSEKFSEFIDRHFSSDFGLSNRGVKQAGFYVLVGASMPSVLIEAGFLSNRTDAAYLSSNKGQEKTAELIFESIKSFKTYYDSFLGMQ